MGNLRERTLSASFFNPKFYTKNEIENFVTLAADFTPALDEEPVLTAEVLAYEDIGTISDAEYIEKPEIAETLTSVNIASAAPVSEQSEKRTVIISHTVADGETLSLIAKKYGISVKTIADANNISSVNNVKPGQLLSIPPADGVIYTVQKGDTLSAIVKKYQGNLAETQKYYSENIKIGQKIVVIGGKSPHAPVPDNRATSRVATSRGVVTRNTSSSRSLAGGGSKQNGYPWGWCTWYAAYRRNIPHSWGNAGQWLSSAKRAGYATGSAPQAGAVIVTRESWYGHVAYVEAVSGDSITISEMNYEGWGVISRRTIPKGSGVVKGYIY